MSTGCAVSLGWDWVLFWHSGSERVGRVSSARDKSLEILGWKLNPGHREDRRWDSFILPQSYHDPGHREDRRWDSFIHPQSYHDPGHGEDRQRDSFMHSPTELSWPGPRRRQTVRYIHAFTHRAIMAWAMERTDSEIHSCIHPQSYHDLGHGEGNQWDTFIHSPIDLLWSTDRASSWRKRDRGAQIEVIGHCSGLVHKICTLGFHGLNRFGWALRANNENNTGSLSLSTNPVLRPQWRFTPLHKSFGFGCRNAFRTSPVVLIIIAGEICNKDTVKLGLLELQGTAKQSSSYVKFELRVMLSLCFSHLATVASPFVCNFSDVLKCFRIAHNWSCFGSVLDICWSNLQCWLPSRWFCSLSAVDNAGKNVAWFPINSNLPASSLPPANI